MAEDQYVCKICGQFINYSQLFPHVLGCLTKARAERARVEQADNTYYGYPTPKIDTASLTDVELANIRETWANDLRTPINPLTEEEKEALSLYAKTSPEFNDIERRV